MLLLLLQYQGKRPGRDTNAHIEVLHREKGHYDDHQDGDHQKDAGRRWPDSSRTAGQKDVEQSSEATLLASNTVCP